jgi:hypothetical protein
MTNPDQFAPVFHRRVTACRAVQVTHQNLPSVALWCGGTTWGASVRVPEPGSHDQAADVGDWIVRVGFRRFEVWSDTDFTDQWVPYIPKVVYQPTGDRP